MASANSGWCLNECRGEVNRYIITEISSRTRFISIFWTLNCGYIVQPDQSPVNARHRCRPSHLFMTNTLNWPRLCCVARDLIHTTGSPEFKFTVTTFDWWLCFTTGRIDDPELYNILLVDLQQLKSTCLSSHSHALLPQRGNNNETFDQSPIQQLRAEIPQTGMEVKDQFAS